MEYYTTMMSHASLTKKDSPAELETPQCSCSECKTEAAFGNCFAITDNHAINSPEIGYLGDGHRCKRFPCPVCNPGTRSLQMLDSEYAQVAVQQLRHGEAAVIFFGDGGHTCRKFPCPVCNNGR